MFFEGIRNRRKIKRLEEGIELAGLERLRKISTREYASNFVDPNEDGLIVRNRGVDDTGKAVDNLENIRQLSRRLYLLNPFAHGIINLLNSFILGDGAILRPVSDNEKTIERQMEIWKEWSNLNKWNKRQQEIVRRDTRDGECFMVFPYRRGVGYLLRFIEPSNIPVNTDNPLMNGGILVDPKDEQTVLAYCTIKDGSVSEKYKDGQVIHSKINADSNVLRGIPALTPTLNAIQMYQDWITDRMELNRVRGTMGLIRKHKATPEKIKEFASAQKTDTGYDNYAGRSYSEQRMYPASVYDVGAGTDYELLSLKINASDVSEDGRRLLLSMAVALGLAEYMVSADSSNSNYSSTMVAESPAVKTIQGKQGYYKDVFSTIFKKVMYLNGETDVNVVVEMPIIIHRDIEKMIKALEIELTGGIISKKEIRRQRGYDDEAMESEIAEEDMR